MSRNISDLHPRLQQKLSELQSLCREQGLVLGIGECLRTVEEQDALYAQGRTAPGEIVTNARGNQYESQHQWGIAADFYQNIAGKAYSDDSFFERVGQLAKSIGLAWGGDWDSPVDRPHLYLPDWGDTPKPLKRQYQIPEAFIATWKPVSDDAPWVDDAVVKEKPDILYAVKLLNGRWQPEVKNDTDYAGVENRKIVGFMARLSNGKALRYRVHLISGRWLPWVTGYDQSDYENGYAGDDKTAIDAVELKCEAYTVEYKSSSIEKGTSYYPVVSDEENDYAGVFGKAMDKIVCVVR